MLILKSKFMKKLYIIIVVAFLGTGALLFNCCDKVNEVLALPSMSATVDGVSWTSIFRATVLFQSNGVFSITGTPDASENVDKAIILSTNGITVGTYNLAIGGSSECAVVYKKTANAAYNSDNYYVSHTATITLTEVNTDKQRISGTFSATLVPSNDPLGAEIRITNGKFENLNYQLQP
jgi:hypothetical protein